MFSYNEKELMKRLGVRANYERLSDADLVEIEEKVSIHLQKNGFDEDYSPTKDGLLCEAILDKL